MKGFKIIKAPFFSRIVDKGISGFNYIGVSQDGAMDEYSYNMANKILENDFNTPCIEMIFGGLQLECQVDTKIVLTGANFDFTINEQKVKNWKSYTLKVGDIISFEKRLSGQRAYLSVLGGFDVEKNLNSATRDLKTGEVLKLKSFKYSELLNTISLKKEFIPKYTDEVTLRVIESYQSDFFSSEQKDFFYKERYEVSSEFSNMGYKLEGKSVTPSKSDIISEGIAYGSIQIPASGKPIVLLKNRQTIGGYPKIGCVIALDCFKLSQMGQGAKVRFEKISLELAQKKLRDFYLYFR